MTTASPARPFRRPRPAAILFAAIAIGAATFGWSAARPAPAPAPAPVRPAAKVDAVSNPQPVNPPDAGLALGAGDVTDTTALTKAAGVWSANLARDPDDFVSAQNLALVLYTRGRLTGSAQDYAAASAAVEQGLKAYPTDLGGRTMKALLQYTLHDFSGALSTGSAVLEADPTALQALATIGDSQLELGDYDAAAKTFDDLETAQPGAAVTARLARLVALRGDEAAAASLAARATTEARAEGSEGPSLAFYPYLEGYLAFQAGRLDDAVAADRAALKAWPGSHLAHEALAKALAAQGRVDAAIAEYQRAIAIVPQPEYLAGLGDLQALAGRADDAARQYATVDAIAGLQASLYNRQLVLFDVNHGRDVAAALTLAQNELATRKDVYGWDAFAWALLANGRAVEADDAMRRALALGTQDSLLDYHAGMIAKALGDHDRAVELLRRALARNPGFDPLQATRARTALSELGATP
ncbi:MAG TPA: tetratricopeptide repeat protein [Candidatus Limnocylindrales bacterium]|nr:tetratricopeptide repeat protein [Candidatus Limnocylindrales bacterium]